MYKIENDTVYIMAIFDSRQNVEELLLQKLLSGYMLTKPRDCEITKPKTVS